MILLLRSNKMIHISNHIVDILNIKDTQMAFYELMQLLFMILFMGHFCGCAFHYLSHLEAKYGFEHTWVDQQRLTNSSWFDQYITAFYWSVITMITVGYGDVVPVNRLEKMFVIVECIVACGVFAYSVNAIGSIVTSLTKSRSEFKVIFCFSGVCRHLVHWPKPARRRSAFSRFLLLIFCSLRYRLPAVKQVPDVLSEGIHEEARDFL